MFVKSIQPEVLEKLEIASFPGEITVIDSVGPEFNRAIRYLRDQKIIGFDTETRPCFSPSQPRYNVSLLQLSGPNKAFLFRIQKLGMHKRLVSILTSDKILKIGAAVADDIRGLQKFVPFQAAGFIDLQKIVWEYGIKDKSVKKMSAIILGYRVSKTQQLSNWEAEELSEGQQKYAATDAWVCREMYIKLQRSEKNPLSPEELLPPMPPEQKLKLEAKAKAKAEREAQMKEQQRAKAERKAKAKAKVHQKPKDAGSKPRSRRKYRRKPQKPAQKPVENN
jgi:ribonuclease D